MGETEPERECPVWLLHQMKEYFTAYAWSKKGVMPRRGGIEDQPHHWIEAFEVIRAEAAMVSRERIDEMRRQNSGGA